MEDPVVCMCVRACVCVCVCSECADARTHHEGIKRRRHHNLWAQRAHTHTHTHTERERERKRERERAENYDGGVRAASKLLRA